jgi:hypothetical protein
MNKQGNLITILCIAIILLACGCVQKGEDSGTTSKPTSNQLPSQYILLNESGTLSSYIGKYTEAPAGKTFLVIKMTIENHGYKTFDINPNYFAVVANKVAYPYDTSTFSTDAPLTTATLLDGGKIAGYLVFKIPKDENRYVFRYIGSGDYQFIYGNLVEATPAPKEEQQPKLPWRSITFDLGEGKGVQTLEPGSSSVVSQAGAIVQTTSFDLGDNGYATIEVRTFQGATNKDQAIKDALKIEKIHDFNVNEVGGYEATLANGETVTVHTRNCAVVLTHRGNFDVSAFMPDSSTVVKVTSTLGKYRVQALLKSLKIGEMPAA